MYKTKMNKPCINFCNLRLTATLIQMYAHTYILNVQLTSFLCKTINHKVVFLPVLNKDAHAHMQALSANSW